MTEAPDVSPDELPDELPDDLADDSVGDGGGEERAEEARTGDVRVDAVLESLADLDERPLDEHTALFEQAHERLREALDPDGGPGPTPDLRSA